MDEDRDVPYSPAPSSVAQSPSPAPSAQTTAQDQAAQQALEFEAADDYIYDLMRIFARAWRAMGRFQCKEVIQELENLPEEQQRSPTVLILLGRAHYELVDYATVCRVTSMVVF